MVALCTPSEVVHMASLGSRTAGQLHGVRFAGRKCDPNRLLSCSFKDSFKPFSHVLTIILQFFLSSSACDCAFLVIIPTDYCKSTVCSLIILMLNVTRFHSSNWKSSQASEHGARMFLPCQWMLTIVWVLKLISNEDPGCVISSIMNHKCLTLTSDRFGRKLDH